MSENLISVLENILEGARERLSDILPSEWTEQRRVMSTDVSPVPGLFSYKNTPYTREIVDCLAPSHPARVVAVQKAAQIGYSSGVIESGIGWIISEAPGNILFLVGHEDLVKDSGKKLDTMIDATGIRHLIKSSSGRARSTKSGDTDTMKEFPNGYLKLGIANHKSLRNISMQYGFIDDFESMKGATEQSGDTAKMIEQRFAAYAKKMKLFYISTPELKETSNIEPQYLLGDQRKFHFPCPCCGEKIRLEWEIPSELNENEMAGIHYELDEAGELIDGSVGYVCYKCGEFFDDSKKMDWLNKGEYIPTAKPKRPGYYSYHISALYAPSFMFGWDHYVRQYLEAVPVGQPRNEDQYKTFKNLVLGETYEPTGESISATELQNNICDYEILSVPEKLSINQGNGKIILLTCGSDLNGKENDARLDYEIVAWSESEANYSIIHGSIGTFVPKETAEQKKRSDRKKWTYRHGEPNSVWPEFDKILGAIYQTDTGRKMRVLITGLDSGYMTEFAYQYADNSNFNVICLKGKDDDKFINLYVDRKFYKNSQEKPGKLFLVEANLTKDHLARCMSLKWREGSDASQPPGYMNFPTPSKGLYLPRNYFSHFEAEHKIVDRRGNFRWLKKSNQHQNHLYDCRLYSIVVKNILVDRVLKQMKIQNGIWTDFVQLVLKRKKK